ncbi:MAG: RNA 2',3'-cyclic phosphodiesterase [Lentisphaerae bacterium]|nr:RNA 2',3'-cyclic phosphodiesterase [Lentisphaerota bacterium]
MRLFVAIKLSVEARRALGIACAPFHALAQDCVWSNPEQLHVTLAFLGDCAPAFLPHLTRAIDAVCQPVAPFTCRSVGFGYFGSRRYPSVIWAGVEPADVIESLHERFWQSFTKLGYERPSARFDAHITLARCKDRTRNAALLEALDAAETDNLGQWDAAGVTLFESRLGPRGASYRPVHQAAFGQARGY